ncbi:SAM-dependent methyltransferase [Clostridium sp. SY8519]|uniref:class I SAM-dependent methyltransferase n=1 Tax=Clostridium sp. (strain SY8519) TaxID=1042156 RepID=UPI000217204F|nr:class I SAM-dependent methyltransferase [Clostridium sp. SY8519]BAK47331.1 SAM-dependent methyltransferase [Clostridium sp. SY8519]
MTENKLTERNGLETAAQKAARQAGLELKEEGAGLTLSGGGRELRADFTRLLPRIRPDNLNREFLVRAARLKSAGDLPLAVDATAGLGEDAFLLAAAGFRVRLYEYDPVIAALLEDGLRRAAEVPELQQIVARMELIAGDSVAALYHLPERPDVVLLDPMFPARKKSALVKKKFQLLQKLELPCADEKELLEAAIAAGPKKIVIKRPLKGPVLAGKTPSYSLRGKAIRYDCLVL